LLLVFLYRIQFKKYNYWFRRFSLSILKAERVAEKSIGNKNMGKNTNHQQMHKEGFIINRNTLLHIDDKILFVHLFVISVFV
jgi:hypothetical protein